MFTYKKDIFELSSITNQKILKIFCEKINNSASDVFVLMAHKAVLLFQILADQDYISSAKLDKKIVISNQALDFDCSYIKGKKVTIVDDIVISGTSLANVVNKLIAAGVSKNDIDIVALAVDEKYLKMNFENVLHCDAFLEDSACIELSAFISRVFSYYGIPYNVDFPVYNPIKVDSKKINLLFNDFLWDTENVTNKCAIEGSAETYTLLPKQYMLDMLWKHIGVNLGEFSHLKIRTYINKFPNNCIECYFMPLCIIDGISKSDLQVLFDIFKPKSRDISLNSEHKCIAQSLSTT